MTETNEINIVHLTNGLTNKRFRFEPLRDWSMKANETPATAMKQDGVEESPAFVRTSLAAAMTMGKTPGKFYRDAKLHCINLLLTYDEGCHAKCSYCGLSKSREIETAWTESSFIRVDWPVFSVDEVKQSLIDGSSPHVERVCISMITNRRARDDCITIVSELSEVIPRISVLITPTIINKDWLLKVKKAGADKVGIAIDAATPEIFESLRGKGVKGPHKWTSYWETLEKAVEIFGEFNAGVHLIVGVGETEKEMIETIQRAHDMGARTHLFSFFPEEGSAMEDHPQPPLGMYRRVQAARYIINKGKGDAGSMKFNEIGQLLDFGLLTDVFDKILSSGEAFMTSGCKGETMDNACNRPFGNCTPGQAAIGHWRNYPIAPNLDDVELVRGQLKDYSLTYEADELPDDFE
ncbi:MAG: radical SAM protein [Candidatus Thorarchaeota archaeon]